MSVRNRIRSGLASFLRMPLIRELSSLPFKSMAVDEYCTTYFSAYTPQKNIIYPAVFQKELLPFSSFESLSWKFKNLETRWIPEAFILRLEKGKVIGNKGAVVTKEGVLLKDVSREFGVRALHSVFGILKLAPVVQQKGNVAVLNTDGGNTYYHWMFDILPRLHLLEKSGLSDKIDFFILPKISHSFQKESLQALGISESKILEAGDKNFHIEADNLFVPSLPSLLGTISNWSSSYIANKILLQHLPQSVQGKRLYISRKNATTRRLLNEDDIIAFLLNYGFTIVVAENYSLVEQAAIFNNADIVLAAHGSGLSNIVFCKEKSTVLELFSSDFIVPCYWVLANNCKLNYHFITNDGRDNYPFKPYWEGVNNDYNFPIEIVEKLFSSLLITK